MSKSVEVKDLMKGGNIVSIGAHQSVGHVRTIFQNNKFSFIPVVNGDNEVQGVVSAKDIINVEDTQKVENIMTDKVYAIPEYENVEIAARMMRNNKIHHLVVTHEKKLTGVLSSYDLLKLIEGKRFVEKNPSTPKKNKGKRAQANP